MNESRGLCFISQVQDVHARCLSEMIMALGLGTRLGFWDAMEMLRKDLCFQLALAAESSWKGPR